LDCECEAAAVSFAASASAAGASADEVAAKEATNGGSDGVCGTDTECECGVAGAVCVG
jgi:hypothetical protein